MKVTLESLYLYGKLMAGQTVGVPTEKDIICHKLCEFKKYDHTWIVYLWGDWRKNRKKG